MHPDETADLKFYIMDSDGNMIDVHEAIEDIREAPEQEQTMYEQYCNPADYDFEVSARIFLRNKRGALGWLIGRKNTKACQKFIRSSMRWKEKERRRKLKEGKVE